MKVRVVLEDPTPEDLDRLRDFLAPYTPAVEIQHDDTWSTDRIERYFLALPPNAQRILEEAVARGGYVEAEALRGDGEAATLKGHSAGLKRVLDRSVREGWCPETIVAPVQAQGPGFGKVVGYRIAADLFDAFSEAVLSLPTNRRAVLSKEINQRGPDVLWDTQLAVEVLGIHGLDTTPKGARAVLRHLAVAGLIVKTDPTRAVYRIAADQ
ncbi:hypothetical protein ACFVVU_38690 [Kitasatospora sp. NPDC057965]|uniref:hypothetical protein n=1 Tax=Kitasatospora sp. NPDC057965 TaxID=3346291 RepID=UPI0036D93F04